MNPLKKSQLIDKAVSLKRIGQYREALKIYDEILAIIQDSNAFYARGKLHYILGSYENAINDYLFSIDALLDENELPKLIVLEQYESTYKLKFNRIANRIGEDYLLHIGAATMRSRFITEKTVKILQRPMNFFTYSKFIGQPYLATIDPYFAKNNLIHVNKFDGNKMYVLRSQGYDSIKNKLSVFNKEKKLLLKHLLETYHKSYIFKKAKMATEYQSSMEELGLQTEDQFINFIYNKDNISNGTFELILIAHYIIIAVKACHRRNHLPNEKHYNLRVTIEIC